MRREAGGQPAQPQRAVVPCGVLRGPEAVGGCHGDAGPQCKSFPVASASPPSTFSTRVHKPTQSSALVSQMGELRPGRRDSPKVTWRRGLDNQLPFSCGGWRHLLMSVQGPDSSLF